MADDTKNLERWLNELKQTVGGGGNSDPPIDGIVSAGDNEGMEARITRLEATLPHLATKSDISDVRGDIQRGIGETHKWMIGTVIGLFLGFGGLFLAMSNALKPAQTSAPPIIINVPAAQAPAAEPPAK